MAPDEDEEPISDWLRQLPNGDSLAQNHIYRTYARKLRKYAREKLGNVPLVDSDEEDVVTQVMASLFARLRDPNAKQPGDRKELWKLLLTMTRRRSIVATRYKLAQRRSNSTKPKAGPGGNPLAAADALDQSAHPQPDPQQAFIAAEKFLALLAALDDQKSRQIALMKLANYSNQEIANKLQCSERTVERRISQMRTQLMAKYGRRDPEDKA